MKLKQYIKQLNAIVELNPEYLDLDVITSIDDEGNGYNNVRYAPSAGIMFGGEFIGLNDKESIEMLKIPEPIKPDVICVN